LAAQVHTADIQDREGATALLAAIRYLFPWLRHVFADGGYACYKLAAALGGRANLRLAQPQPPPRQGLRDVARQQPSLDLSCLRPTGRAPARSAYR
jgi:hypothetical protein